MPLFEYRCDDCEHAFEVLVRADTHLECPACHGVHLQKQLSVFAVSAQGDRVPSYAASAPCGSCGHPDGPGSCRVN